MGQLWQCTLWSNGVLERELAASKAFTSLTCPVSPPLLTSGWMACGKGEVSVELSELSFSSQGSHTNALAKVLCDHVGITRLFGGWEVSCWGARLGCSSFLSWELVGGGSDLH